MTSKATTWLHLLLVAGILLYAYAPFLDHWLGRDVYARPHNHIHLTTAGPALQVTFHENDAGDHEAGHDGHEDGVLCSLDIDALLSLLLLIFVAPPGQAAAPDLLAARLAPVCYDVSLVYLAALDPPPNI